MAQQSSDDDFVFTGVQFGHTPAKQQQDIFETSTPMDVDQSNPDRFRHVTTRRPRVPMPSGNPGSSKEKDDDVVTTNVHKECWKMLSFLHNKSTDSEGVSKTIQDQSVRLQLLLTTVSSQGRERVFMNEALLGQEFVNDESLLANTYNLIGELFPEGFANFNEGTALIVQDYIGLLIDIYRIQNKQMPRILSPYIKFVVIAIVFGADRAIYSLQSKDRMFFDFTWDENDKYFGKMCDVEIKELDRSRNSYYKCFRNDGFDPRKKEKKPDFDINNVTARIIEEQQKIFDYFKPIKEEQEKARLKKLNKNLRTILVSDSDSENEFEDERKRNKKKS